MKDKACSKRLRYANLVLFILIILIATVLIIGSIYAMFRSSADNGIADNFTQTDIFSGIGMLRIPIGGKEPATVAIQVNFRYPADNIPFYEELASRVGDFRTIIRQYFSAFSKEDLLRFDENAMKAEILKQYNEILVLGKIESLIIPSFDYF